MNAALTPSFFVVPASCLSCPVSSSPFLPISVIRHDTITSLYLHTHRYIDTRRRRRFLWDQERELWEIFQDLDKNGDGRLDAAEMRAALARGSIDITPDTAQDLVRFLASGSKNPQPPGGEDMYITFQEFRDFLFMLPRRATPFEIYKCEWRPPGRVPRSTNETRSHQSTRYGNGSRTDGARRGWTKMETSASRSRAQRGRRRRARPFSARGTHKTKRRMSLRIRSTATRPTRTGMRRGGFCLRAVSPERVRCV